MLDHVQRNATIEDVRREFAITETRALGSNRYQATIAVNDDVGDGLPVNLRDMDTAAYMKNPVVLYSHDRWSRYPIGQTLALRWDDAGRLLATFKFSETNPEAKVVRSLWEEGILRAASLSARPEYEGDGSVGPFGYGGGKVERYRMTEWSIVAVPADPDAVRSAHWAAMQSILKHGGNDMNEEQVRAMIERHGADLKDETKRNDALVRMINEAVTATTSGQADSIKRAVEDALKAQADAQKAEADRLAAERAAGANGTGGANGAAGAPAADQTTDEQIAQRADERAQLLRQCDGLLPDDFDSVKATNRELLVAAVGDEVPDKESKSEDYLRAMLDTIVTRRSQAGPGGGDPTAAGGTVARGTQAQPAAGGAATPVVTSPLTGWAIRRMEGRAS